MGIVFPTVLLTVLALLSPHSAPLFAAEQPPMVIATASPNPTGLDDAAVSPCLPGAETSPHISYWIRLGQHTDDGKYTLTTGNKDYQLTFANGTCALVAHSGHTIPSSATYARVLATGSKPVGFRFRECYPIGECASFAKNRPALIAGLVLATLLAWFFGTQRRRRARRAREA